MTCTLRAILTVWGYLPGFFHPYYLTSGNGLVVYGALTCLDNMFDFADASLHFSKLSDEPRYCSWIDMDPDSTHLLRQFLCCFHDYVHTSGRLGRSIDPWVEKDGRVANCSPVWKFPDISQADCFGLLSFRWQCTETKNKHLQSSRSCATWHCWRHSTSLILTLNTKGWKQSSDLMKASMSQTMTSTASRFELVVFCRMFLANLIPWLAAGGQVCKKLGALQEDSSVCRNAFSCILVHRIWPRVFWLQDVSQLLETWNWLIQSD